MEKTSMITIAIMIICLIAPSSLSQGLGELPIPVGAEVNGTGEGGVDDTTTTTAGITTTTISETTTTRTDVTTTTLSEEADKPLGSLGGGLDFLTIAIIVAIMIAIGGAIYLIIKKKGSHRVPKAEADLIRYVQDSRKKGFTDDAIRKRLQLSGYQSHKIDKIMKESF